MAFINSCHERTELGKGRFQSVVHLKPVAYADAGVWKANVLAYESKGAQARPLVLDRAPLIAQVGAAGLARFCPVRDDLSAYVEFGAPSFKVAEKFEPVAGLSAASLGKAQAVSWNAPNFEMQWLHAGHYGAWVMRNRRGWKVPDALRFPVTLPGLERKGDTFMLKGAPVCHMRAPVARDVADPMNVVPLGYDWVDGGVVIDTSKLDSREWEVDPTLVLQPDAAAGKDAMIRSDAPTYNYGVANYGHIGNTGVVTCRLLVQYDLTTLPDQAIIFSAQEQLTPTADYSTNARAFRIYRMNRTWVEGVSIGGLLGNGATWNTYDATNVWQTAGAAGVNDYDSTAIGSRDFTATETLNVPKTFVLTPTTKATLDYGYGWIHRADTENEDLYQMASSDHATPAYRPQLTVVWALPGGGGIFTSGVFHSGIISGGIVR